MDDRADLLEFLKSITGGIPVLTTKQLATATSQNYQALTRKRNAGEFEIPHKKLNGNIVYSIYAVADYLLSDDEPKQSVEPSITIQKRPRTRKVASSHTSLPDLSKKVLMRGFCSYVESQLSLTERIAKTMNIRISKIELDSELSRKEEVEVKKDKEILKI